MPHMKGDGRGFRNSGALVFHTLHYCTLRTGQEQEQGWRDAGRWRARLALVSSVVAPLSSPCSEQKRSTSHLSLSLSLSP